MDELRILQLRKRISFMEWDLSRLKDPAIKDIMQNQLTMNRQELTTLLNNELSSKKG